MAAGHRIAGPLAAPAPGGASAQLALAALGSGFASGRDVRRNRDHRPVELRIATPGAIS